MKDDDVQVFAKPRAKRAVLEGLELPANLHFPDPSPPPPASPRLLQDETVRPQVLRRLADFLGFHGTSGSRRPQVKKASPDRPPSIVVNGEGEEDAALVESMHSADREIVADDSEDDDSDGVVIDVENQNADRT
ncbi:hypothetical protein ACJRO7_010285 [Eucalyptus globulus]|uniref:Uncharacterized protein n=1 Tax=Eucalyptus globulus TaxID=34317 RepID=A0ABD3LBR2_EUCGL